MSSIISQLCTKYNNKLYRFQRYYATAKPKLWENGVTVQEQFFKRDDYTNVTTKIHSYVGKNLHTIPYHPLCLIKQRIVSYFYNQFQNSRGNPLFSVYDNLSPMVSVEQNFDSLLIPLDHPSRSKSDCYYLNREHLLRAHTTAHQSELVKSGLNNFLIVGDVYRRDEIDKSHYPVFHQLDGVRLRTKVDLFGENPELELYDKGGGSGHILGNQEKQECHSLEAVKLMEHELKTTLEGLARHLFGQETQVRWTDSVFPFTQPSWELEVHYNSEWVELLGCGIMKQPILNRAGAENRIGWAFGLGLERMAMCLYQIPDIRLFWSRDSGFLSQFKTDSDRIIFKSISVYPQCTNDISFWIPGSDKFNKNDFYDLVRTIGGDFIEQVTLIDEFQHPKTGLTSHSYRIVYRHMERTLTKKNVNIIHSKIAEAAQSQFNVKVRT